MFRQLLESSEATIANAIFKAELKPVPERPIQPQFNQRKSAEISGNRRAKRKPALRMLAVDASRADTSCGRAADTPVSR